MADARPTAPPGLPAAYPWSAPVTTGAVGPHRLLAGDLVAPEHLTDKIPVLAVGSNAAAAVLRRKLAGLLHPPVPVCLAVVARMGIGHSAHVSAGGYVAAAPFRDDGATSPVVLCWLDRAQLAALDATEPNYARMTLPAALGCRTADGHRVPGAQVYDSRHGVLAEAGSPLPLTSQTEVLAWLAARLPDAREYGLHQVDPHERLTEPRVREAIRRDIGCLGLRSHSGLMPP